MDYHFKPNDIEQITEVLLVKPQIFDNSWTWTLKNKNTGNVLLLTINNEIKYSNTEIGNLISVQTQYGYFEIHSCSAYMVFLPDEIIFINSQNNYISCLIVGKEANCSLFTNIRKELLKSNYTNLDTPLLLSAMQLSIVESIIS